MRVLVTGGDSFIGRALVSRLLDSGRFNDRKIQRLLLLDQSFEYAYADSRVRMHSGFATDSRLVRRILADGVDVVFHLAGASYPVSERDYLSSYQLNLVGSLGLIEQLRLLRNRPRLIFASSVEVYGRGLTKGFSGMPLAEPVLSSGTHKRMIELMIEDLGRRGELDGCAVRLPEVLAKRERGPSDGIAFMSDLLNSVAEGHSYRCPVSKDATAWCLSLDRCLENLMSLAEFDKVSVSRHRVVQLPALQLTVNKLLDVLEKQFGSDRRSLVTFEPDPVLESLVGRFPKMRSTQARDLRLRHDGNGRSLIKNALSPHTSNSSPSTASFTR